MATLVHAGAVQDRADPVESAILEDTNSIGDRTMDWFVNISQAFIACAMLDVWLVRYNRPGLFRGGQAKTMAEEFEHYGLSVRFRHFIRVSKLTLGGMMIVGIWFPWIAVIAAVGLAVLPAGAVAMHLKVKDPLYKALPSSTFLVLSALIAYMQWGRIELP